MQDMEMKMVRSSTKMIMFAISVEDSTVNLTVKQ